MEKIGFIGLGIMGKPMALNLRKAGFPVWVLQASKAADELVRAGAQAASTPGELARQCTVLITMLPDAGVVEDVLTGSADVLEALQPGSLFIDMSTIGPAPAQRLYELCQQKGIDALDAPVSGGQVGAEQGTLSIMAGGTAAAFERALPIFRAMGKQVGLMGGPGAGQTTKACNQLLVGVTIQAVAEAFALARHSGVDLDKMREVLLGGFAQSRVLDLHGQRMITGDFTPGGKLKFHLKDMNIALSIGEAQQVPLKAATLVANQMSEAIAQGKGELDHSVLYQLLS